MERRNFFKVLAGATTGLALSGQSSNAEHQSTENVENVIGPSFISDVKVDKNGNVVALSNGNVGIGQGSPSMRLHVLPSNSQSGIIFKVL